MDFRVPNHHYKTKQKSAEMTWIAERSAGQRYNGLKNQGATCYLNSVLQCLYMTEDFRREVENFRSDPQNSEEESVDLMQELQELFKILKEYDGTTEGITRCLRISNVREQQDAVEYYQKTLNIIRPQMSKIFEGELKNCTKCLSAIQHQHEEKCSFFTIPLSIESEPSEVFSVEKGLKNFSKKVKLDEDNLVYCEHCGQKAEAETWTEIEEFPTILTLYLKRFYFDYYQMKLVKNQCFVDIPLQLLIKNCKYELYAIINHMGGQNGGHYNAVIKSFEDNEWYCFDDSFVTKKQRQDLEESLHCSNLGYLLMYRKKMDVHHLNESTNSTNSGVQAGQFKIHPGYHPTDVEKERDQHHHCEQLFRSKPECLTQGFAQLDLGVYEEQLNQMEKSPNEVKMSFVYTEDQAQTDMSDTQIDKSHKDFTGKEMTLLDVRASDMRKERHIEQYCSEKIGTVTKDGLDQEFRVENLSKYLKKSSEYTSFIAFVYIEATKERLSIYQTKMKNLITAGTTLQLLEAQAAIGHVIDLSSDGNLTVSEAVKMGVVGPEFKSKLLFAEQAVTGYKDPYLPNGKLSLLQAIKKDIVLESQGIRLLKFQIATGGIIDSENSHRLPVDVAYKCGLFDEKMYRILTDPSSDTKGFFDPNTKKNLTYSQLMEQCITDPKTGHSFLLLKEKKTFCF